jgi:crotonobetainyl-CoA:carnitine CoA-transferase CaiB-like acyl-CoA transferase
MAPLPLEGIRIIDLTVVWAGPFATALLGDLGAEVIRVESLQRWDTNNRMLTPPAAEVIAHTPDAHPQAPQWEISANHGTVNRAKKSVTMDLTRPEGRDAFYRLVKVADIFVENNGPDVVQHLGLDYAKLSEINPKLIMASMAGFGAYGPYHNFRAYGANMEAVVGHALLRGYTDMDPTSNSNVFFADACGGATGAFALLAALHHRNRTGRGQFIDMSQAENVAHTFSQAIMDYSMNGRIQGTRGNRDFSRAQGVYRCAGDDRWLTISVGSDAELVGLCQVMGRPDLAADPRFADGLSRHKNHDALDAQIAAWTASQEHYDAFHALQAAGVPCSPVLDVSEVATDPQLWARDMFQQITHPYAGTHQYLKPSISNMSETPLQYRDRAATLGEHNEYVYKDLLGYSDAEYQWFVENDHAGTAFLNQKR